MSVTLHNIADLTHVVQQGIIDMTIQELTGDWRGYQVRTPTSSAIQPAGVPAPTQQLGAALFSVPGLEGFLTASAKVPTRMNLVVFPSKLVSSSQIAYEDNSGTVIHTITGTL